MTEKGVAETLALEKTLPAEFLYTLGLYLQTCAHIELASCALIACLSGIRPKDQNWQEAYVKNRKLPTAELIRSLKQMSSEAEKYGFETELVSLCDWIERFKDNRHMAVHGAFFGSPSGFLRVEFIRNAGTRKKPDWQETRTAITKEMVDDVVKDANAIYLILLGMIEAISPNLVSEVHRAVVPIVSHPESPVSQ